MSPTATLEERHAALARLVRMLVGDSGMNARFSERLERAIARGRERPHA